MNLRFAFAVNNDNQFEKKHFGDADKYMIYQEESGKIVLSSEQQDEILQILIRHIHWIKDEWEEKKSNFKLFTIKSGILKSAIKK